MSKSKKISKIIIHNIDILSNNINKHLTKFKNFVDKIITESDDSEAERKTESDNDNRHNSEEDINLDDAEADRKTETYDEQNIEPIDRYIHKAKIHKFLLNHQILNNHQIKEQIEIQFNIAKNKYNK